MELRQFKYFVAIVDSGSVSRAAQTLYIAQSALSKQISDLERELDAQLLDRTRSGVRVTESGRIFYEYSMAIIKQIDDVRAAVKSSEQHIVGTVALAIPQSISHALVLPLSIAAKRQLSGIQLNLNEELTGNLVDQLQQGRIDIAILTDNLPLKGFRLRPIAREELFLITAAEQVLPLDSGALTIESVMALPLVLSGKEHSHCMRSIIESAAAERDTRIKNVVAEINSVHVLKSAVLAGIGCTIFPKAPVALELEQGTLVAHRIGPAGLFRTLVLCVSKSIPLTNPKRAVADLITGLAGQLCASGKWPGATAVTPAPDGAGPDEQF